MDLPENVSSTYRVVILSVGTASAGVVAALRKALPFSEERLAACIYQAPAELLDHLDQETAVGVVEALRNMGLQAEVFPNGQTFCPGGAEFDVALAIQSTDRLFDLAREIADFLGVTFPEARQILCASPAELIGKVSANTVEVIRNRFERLGAEVDVSCRAEAVFDLFLGECTPPQREQVHRRLVEAGIASNEICDDTRGESSVPVIAGLRESQARACFERLKGISVPFRIINRDFQRFDIRLDFAPASSAMTGFLRESAGMPEAVARKIPTRTPIVTHHNLTYSDTQRHLSKIIQLGGQASAHLLALRSVRLHLDRVGDPGSTARLLEMLGGLDIDAARDSVRAAGVINHPATIHQARWLQKEMRRVGTEARLVLA